LLAAVAKSSDAPVIRAFSSVIDLDYEQSVVYRRDVKSALNNPPTAGHANRQTRGEHPPLCGGLVIVQRDYLQLLGGWDERFLGWGGEDDAMSLKVARAGIQVHVMQNAPAYHLHHRRAEETATFVAEYQANQAVLAHLTSLSEPALKRFCEVTWQLAGNQNMHRPRTAA
jgi:GT2 family glycosyltransferase